MSDKFNGFSQEEINKVSGVKNSKRQSGETMKQGLRNPLGIRRMPEKVLKQADQMRKQLVCSGNDAKAVPKTNSCIENHKNDFEEQDDTLNLDRSMSKSLEDALFFAPLKNQSKVNPHKSRATATSATAGATESASSNSTTTSTDDSSILKLTDSNSIDDSTLLNSPKPASDVTTEVLNTESPFKGMSLKDFESHRKMIEEQNKEKKQLLYKAIEQHTQKTAAEARKIEDIRHELTKLETDIAVDVALLRKQIDNACIHFANVEKQYIKIEGQFLKAKMDLHCAAEKKELLTEHLCTVIAHNEDRKAQKLTELMQKVGLVPDNEYAAPTTPEN